MEVTKMDIRWIVDEQMNAVANGGCKLAATSGILNAMLMAEAETIQQYQYAKQALIKLFADDEAKAQVLAKLVDNVVEDEEDHIESFNRAAAIIVGRKEPKPTEYDEAEDND
jgi:hypothetical protein